MLAKTLAPARPMKRLQPDVSGRMGQLFSIDILRVFSVLQSGTCRVDAKAPELAKRTRLCSVIADIGIMATATGQGWPRRQLPACVTHVTIHALV
jgi:hypothetical protein